MSEAPSTSPAGHWPQPHQALLVALTTTALVTVVSRVAPDEWANTAVGAVFLGATWLMVLRGDTAKIRAYGLSLGGITEPEPLDLGRIARGVGKAVVWSLVLAAICYPPFWLAYKMAWTSKPFAWGLPPDFASHALGQLLVIALPEEAFFRGYLQSALEGAYADRRWRILGTEVGLGWILAAFIFAVGHVLTIPNPARLGVFVPALIFGWMRAKTGGIGAGVLFHAMCNLLSSFLAHGYGLR